MKKEEISMSNLISASQAQTYNKASVIFDDLGKYHIKFDLMLNHLLTEINHNLKTYIENNLNNDVLRNISTNSLDYIVTNKFKAIQIKYDNFTISFEDNQQTIGSQTVFIKFIRSSKTQSQDTKDLMALQKKREITVNNRTYQVTNFAPLDSDKYITKWQLVLTTDVSDLIKNILQTNGYKVLSAKTKKVFSMNSAPLETTKEIIYQV